MSAAEADPEASRRRRFAPLRRIAAMVLRYWYLLRHSWPRILDLIYWPTVQMLMWGFLQTYLSRQSGGAYHAGGALIGAVLLWDILFRGQIGFSVSFLEEMWSRNLGNLMMTPAAPGGARVRADGDERRAGADRPGAGDADGDLVLRLQPVGPGTGVRRRSSST